MRKHSGRLIACALALAAAVPFCAYAAGVPGCAAQPTINTIRDLYREGLEAALMPGSDSPPHERERLQRLVKGYLSEVRISVTDVVSNGFDQNAQRYSCEGRISVESPTAGDGGLSIRSNYTSQAVQDGNGRFLVRVEEYQNLLRAVAITQFPAYARARVSADARSNPAMEAAYQQKGREIEERRTGMPATRATYVMGANVLTFTRTSNEKLKFEYESEAPAGTCSIGGVASVLGSDAHFAENSQVTACQIQFIFDNSGGLLVDSTNKCLPGCPPNDHKLDGRYTKR